MTIRNAVIQCNNSSYAVLTSGTADTTGTTTVEHVTVICTGRGDADANLAMTHSYIHDMFHGDSVATDPHTDGIQVWPGTPAIVYSDNTVLMRDDNAACTCGDPVNGAVAHLTIEGNLVDGGSYTVYCGNNVGSLSNNRFGPIGPNHTAPWGHTDSCGAMTRSGNIEDATNQPIPASVIS